MRSSDTIPKKPCFDAAVHAVSMRIHGEIIFGEHKAIEGVFGDGGEEERAPTTVERRRLLEDEGDHRLDVEDHNSLSMELCLLRFSYLASH